MAGQKVNGLSLRRPLAAKCTGLVPSPRGRPRATCLRRHRLPNRPLLTGSPRTAAEGQGSPVWGRAGAGRSSGALQAPASGLEGRRGTCGDVGRQRIGSRRSWEGGTEGVPHAAPSPSQAGHPRSLRPCRQCGALHHARACRIRAAGRPQSIGACRDGPPNGRLPPALPLARRYPPPLFIAAACWRKRALLHRCMALASWVVLAQLARPSLTHADTLTLSCRRAGRRMRAAAAASLLAAASSGRWLPCLLGVTHCCRPQQGHLLQAAGCGEGGRAARPTIATDGTAGAARRPPPLGSAAQLAVHAPNASESALRQCRAQQAQFCIAPESGQLVPPAACAVPPPPPPPGHEGRALRRCPSILP